MQPPSPLFQSTNLAGTGETMWSLTSTRFPATAWSLVLRHERPKWAGWQPCNAEGTGQSPGTIHRLAARLLRSVI